MKYHHAQVCLGGHLITDNASIPKNCKDICPECNKQTIKECPNCQAKILGIAISGEERGYYNKPPEKCHKCNEPYPWAK